MKISEISIKRSTIPVVIFTILALAGIFCYTLLNKELTPNMEVPVNAVMTIYPGAAPSEVESSVTKKIEDAVSAVAGIDKITSFSLEGISAVMITYKDDVDSDLALQECERKVNAIINNLPENIKDPQFMKVDLNMFPIMSLAVNSDIPEKEFYDVVDKDLAPQLSQIKGVASVEILGGNKREIEVKADAQKLKQYGLSLLQVQQAIGASNVDFPTGKIKNDDTKYIVRLAGKYSNLEQIREQIVGASKDGSVIRVCDIATVVDGSRKANKFARFNGQPVIGLTIQKQTDGNAVEISKEVHEKIAEFEQEYASNNLKFTITSDSSEFTQSAIDSVMMDLLLAIILVSVTMLLFLHTFRNLMFVFISIPLSIISTFAFFYLFGFSLNLLTLLAMSIVVGVIVDDAIVVLENIYRHLEMGKSRREASLDAVKEIGLTVTSITIVLIAVFLPIGLTSGVTGQLLRSFSLVIVMSILVSLLVSFTIVPLLTSRLGKLKVFDQKRPLDRFLMSFEKIVNSFKSAIMTALNWTLGHKRITIITVVALFLSSFLLVSKGFIQTEFMDAGDRGEFVLTMELERTSTLEKTTSKCQSIERKILSYPEVEHVFTKVGTKGGSVSFMETPYGAEFSIKMVPINKRDISSRIFSKKLQYDLQKEFPGPKFKTQEVSIMGTTSSPITIYVRGNDLDKVKAYSNVVLNELRAIQGTTDVESSLESGDKELVVKFDREKLAKLGLTIGEIGSQMYLSFEGNRDLKYSEGGNEYDIYVSLDEFDRERRSDIENISFTNRMGQTITLSQVADITESESPSMLSRYDKMPSAMISGNLVGKTIGTVGSEIKERLAHIDKPAGVNVVYSGQMDMQSKSFSSMGIALLASIIFMYLIMVMLYDSYVYPMVVMASLPLSIIGALLALALAGKSLSMFSIMGIVMLMGLVAKNAILVVDFANNMQKSGHSAIESIKEATSVRFRPILMTNLALIVGLLPLALATGPGAEWKTGLGWVLVGGLTSSMFLSLLVVPVIYILLDKVVHKFKKEK